MRRRRKAERGMEAEGRGFKGWAHSHCQAASKSEAESSSPARPNQERVSANWDE